MQSRLIGGTPYAKNALGTVTDFAQNVNSAQLLRFYDTWYHPNNAIYVIVGDVDPTSTIAQVRELFGDVPAAKLPARPAVRLAAAALGAPITTRPISRITAVLLGYRFPGYDSPDYAAGQILGDVLSSQRSTFGGYAVHRQGVWARSSSIRPTRRSGSAIAFGAVPVSTPPETIDRADA